MYGLKTQKLLAQGSGRKQHALKGQKLLAQGVLLVSITPGLRASAPSGRVGKNLRNFNNLIKLSQVQ